MKVTARGKVVMDPVSNDQANAAQALRLLQGKGHDVGRPFKQLMLSEKP